jgi:DNA-binding IclR family transcriptional regulator
MQHKTPGYAIAYNNQDVLKMLLLFNTVQPKEKTSTEISKGLDMVPGSAFGIVGTMEAKVFLEKSAKSLSGLWRLR